MQASLAIATMAFPASQDLKARNAAAARLISFFVDGGRETALQAGYAAAGDRRLMMRGASSLERRLQARIRAGQVGLQALRVWKEGGLGSKAWSLTEALREKAGETAEADMTNERHRWWRTSIPVLHLAAAFCRYITIASWCAVELPTISELIAKPIFPSLWLKDAPRLAVELDACPLLDVAGCDFLPLNDL